MTAMTDGTLIPVFTHPSPAVRRVPMDRPWHWLRLGWDDMAATPPISLGYGLILAAVGFFATAVAILDGWLALLLPLTGGFMLLAPLLSVTFYEASRRRERGLPPDAAACLNAWRGNLSAIGAFGVVLLLMHLFWVRLATLLYALMLGDVHVPPDGLAAVLLTPAALPFLIVGTLLGAALALATFTISVVTLPLLLDRDVGVLTAVATSITAVRASPRAMLLWAALIAGAVALGMVTLFIGLVPLLPLIGHASWHAYRDVVRLPAAITPVTPKA
ncbi:putative membrane protein [Nitrospirillum amazonense]|uniref:Putative membrane protein n=1 Tax=Nitrospirillum amazonense TaxID=28077 RepID=A0A560FK02_9PROT|nr:DUF2189 domain-containing protein [Nitrospirillum amazonense]TWB21943.1 putative membrane protein [Nitrospirillum amazonense]